MQSNYSIDELDSFDDQKLKTLDWKNLTQLNGRLLELHAQGELGNEQLAKLPMKPILCIDQIERIDDEAIEATFTFPETPESWAFDPNESLEMLFQDQLDQLVGFWGARKADGIGRALSSGNCKLFQSLNYVPGKTIKFALEKRKWVINKTTGSATAIFNGRILDEDGNPILQTDKVIVGILVPEEIYQLRKQYGGQLGVDHNADTNDIHNLSIPIYDAGTHQIEMNGEQIDVVTTTQAINPQLWPLRFHFKGDPVVPGNFGTHGMIALLKEMAQKHFGLQKPEFTAMTTKKFSGMIFEDPKQIRFELQEVAKQEDGSVVAKQANLYLEDQQGNKLIDTPIYTFKNLTVSDSV